MKQLFREEISHDIIVRADIWDNILWIHCINNLTFEEELWRAIPVQEFKSDLQMQEVFDFWVDEAKSCIALGENPIVSV